MIGVFTFGSGQRCTCGRELRDHYTEIEGETLVDARRRMVLAWDSRWSGAYASREEAGVDRFNLKRLVTCFPWSCAGCPCGGLEPQLAYRKEPPDVAGFWWLLDDAGLEQVVEVQDAKSRPYVTDQDLVVFFPGEGHGWRTLSECRARGWAGPIPKARRP